MFEIAHRTLRDTSGHSAESCPILLTISYFASTRRPRKFPPITTSNLVIYPRLMDDTKSALYLLIRASLRVITKPNHSEATRRTAPVEWEVEGRKGARQSAKSVGNVGDAGLWDLFRTWAFPAILPPAAAMRTVKRKRGMRWAAGGGAVSSRHVYLQSESPFIKVYPTTTFCIPVKKRAVYTYRHYSSLLS